MQPMVSDAQLAGQLFSMMTYVKAHYTRSDWLSFWIWSEFISRSVRMQD